MYEIVLIIIHITIRLCSRMVRSSHIAKVVLGPTRHEDMLPCHGLSLVKKLCHASCA
jgi:hypothetical protein